ncbi:hypothetical protein NDU88_000359 [Pleurodeles waltl]|uniref:PH domain-containing protein n=1 Tax=Pleurodeles waltl TaxID=8319 RepID=A0AAV7S6R6_PLEWA|nr:hypothetical protein NDU88_000359 [Pleurodeles waltl]
MEGPLHKWTNYLTGWQPRYFVLDSGILSYYDSQEDVGKGSKGSIKMAVCEIKVHSTDTTRVDLVIPGEQYFYLKATNAADRQKWLVALGSAKACLGDSRTRKEKEVHLGSESLTRKISELRLFCDLLTQQVLEVQQASRVQEDGTKCDSEKISDTSSLLQHTCSQFITTLEECMKFANESLSPNLLQSPMASSPPDYVGAKLPHSHRIRRSLSHTGVVTPNRQPEPNPSLAPRQKGGVTVLRNLEEMVMFRSHKGRHEDLPNEDLESSFPEEDEAPSQPVQDFPVQTITSENHK